MIHPLLDFLRSAAAFALVLGILVFFHEFGHYLAARWCGVHVEAFSIGFGRALTHWTDRKGTVWKLAWLPLGGYVKMHGMERLEDAPPERRATWIRGRTFHEKSVGARAIIVAAGPAANFVLAAVLFMLLFATLGHPVTQPVVSAVLPDSAAAHAGLMAGDRIVAIDGSPVSNFDVLRGDVAHRPGARITVVVKRGDAERTVPVTLGAAERNGTRVGLLGIEGGEISYQRDAPGAAVWGGLKETWNVTSQTVMGLVQIITTRAGASDLGGPLRIAQLSGQVAALGVGSLVTFIAILSINLGLINLFPIPVLDGGHLVFFLCETLRGRPLPARAQEYGLRAGLVLLVGIMVFATWNDLGHFGLFH